jgi:hypothetical protein
MFLTPKPYFSTLRKFKPFLGISDLNIPAMLLTNRKREYGTI